MNTHSYAGDPAGFARDICRADITDEQAACLQDLFINGSTITWHRPGSANVAVLYSIWAAVTRLDSHVRSSHMQLTIDGQIQELVYISATVNEPFEQCEAGW
jgi:hypothetical protein